MDLKKSEGYKIIMLHGTCQLDIHTSVVECLLRCEYSTSLAICAPGTHIQELEPESQRVNVKLIISPPSPLTPVSVTAYDTLS